MKQFFFPILLVLAFFISSCSGGSSSKNEVKTEDAVKPETEAQVATSTKENKVSSPGEALYKANCLACHQADGSGVPNMYPPLSPNEWIKDKDKLIGIMLKGLSGEITVGEDTYNNAMPPHNGMSDKELAEVLTYVRSSFGNQLGPITEEEVSAARK